MFNFQKIKNMQWISALRQSIPMVRLIDLLRSLNWKFALVGGLILSVCSAGIGSIAEFAAVMIIPALMLIHKYLAEKLPEWLDKAVSGAITALLTKLFLKILSVCVGAFLGINLF